MDNYLVTGGSFGIGREVVQSLIEKGYKVFNLDIKEPEKILDNEVFIKHDLKYYHCIKNIIPTQKYKGLFLNVGVHKSGTIFSQSLEEIENLMSINLLSNIAVIKALENNFQDNSSIVFNGSDQCFIGKTTNFAYGMTKGAIAQITKSLAKDLAPLKIRVNTICPSTTRTPLYEDAMIRMANREGVTVEEAKEMENKIFPLNRIAEPKEIANAVCFLLSDESIAMTGTLLPIDGGYTATNM